MKLERGGIRSQVVMVRAYGGEPVRLSAGRSGHAVVVYGDDPEVSIGFPEDAVYRFDARLFSRLCASGRQR